MIFDIPGRDQPRLQAARGIAAVHDDRARAAHVRVQPDRVGLSRAAPDPNRPVVDEGVGIRARPGERSVRAGVLERAAPRHLDGAVVSTWKRVEEGLIKTKSRLPVTALGATKLNLLPLVTFTVPVLSSS